MLDEMATAEAAEQTTRKNRRQQAESDVRWMKEQVQLQLERERQREAEVDAYYQ